MQKLLNAMTELEALKPHVQRWLEELNRKHTNQVNRRDHVHQNFSVDSSLEWPPTKKQTPTIYGTTQVRFKVFNLLFFFFFLTTDVLNVLLEVTL